MEKEQELDFLKLERIANPNGDVFKGLDYKNKNLNGFGEFYFTTVLPGSIKGWKQHKRMTLNLIVISGDAKIVVYDQYKRTKDTFVLGLSNYGCLTIPPMKWVAFSCASECQAIMMNYANIEHCPGEVNNLPLNELDF